MSKEQGPMSGFRDMLADQMIPRQEMLSTIQDVYESYGFTPLKTPALERLETLTGKYGEEGDKLIYNFTDNGGREVAMRYDQTVPLARVVAQHAGRIPIPYKRYTVGEAWRGESPQHGRYREFTQFDADTVGTSSPMSDAETVAMMSDAMEALGAEAIINVNNRRILDGLVELSGLEGEKAGMSLIAAVDKVEKIGASGVVTSVQEQHGDMAAKLTGDYIAITGTPTERLSRVKKLLGGSAAVDEGTENLNSVFTMLEAAGYSEDKIIFDHTIARGLDYYTGIVYETTLTGAPQLGSVCSGGRFDNLVEAMGGPNMPAVGTSIGVDRLYDGLHDLGLLKEAKTTTEVMLANFDANDQPAYLRIATVLRRAGLATEVHYDGKKLGKQISFADKQGIPYVVLAGPDELQEGVATVKDMESGDQQTVKLDELSDTIKSIGAKNE